MLLSSGLILSTLIPSELGTSKASHHYRIVSKFILNISKVDFTCSYILSNRGLFEI